MTYVNEVYTLNETRNDKTIFVLQIETDMPLESLHPNDFPEQYMGQLQFAIQEVAKLCHQGKAVDIVRIKESKGSIVREYAVADLPSVWIGSN